MNFEIGRCPGCGDQAILTADGHRLNTRRRNAALPTETKGRLGREDAEKKDHTLSWNALRAEWNRRMKDKDSEAVADTHRRETPYAREVEGAREAVDYAVGPLLCP